MADRKQKQKWQDFAQKVKKKRLNKESEKASTDIGCHILNSKEMIVQPLESDPSGKAKKYERTGAQEFVEFDYEEVSIENIKRACNYHFKNRIPYGMTCDILASDRGPSCTKMNHLPNLKVIHIRYIKRNDDSGSADRDSGIVDTNPLALATNSRTFSKSSTVFKPQISSLLPKGLATAVETSKKVVPVSISLVRSLPVSSMLKLGKVITKFQSSSEEIETSYFSVNSMSWSAPVKLKFLIDEQPFATGGFRAAYMAKLSNTTRKYVVKRYLESSLTDLNQFQETPECHARKSIQMHSLAANFALQLKDLLMANGFKGEPLLYNKASFGKLCSSSEVVTVEEFVEGNFFKCVNNDGSITRDCNTAVEVQNMSECLTHFSFFKSKEQLMLVDIQGSNNLLYDPEVATMQGSFDEKNELLFCMGNLSTVALENFFKSHKCNDFCKLVKMVDNSKEKDTHE